MRAIKLIDFLALHRVIFSPPLSSSSSISLPESVPLHTSLAAATILHHFVSQPPSCHDLPSAQPRLEIGTPSEPGLASQKAIPSSLSQFEQLHPLTPTLLNDFAVDSTTKQRLYLASALTPYRHLTFVEKKKSKLVVEACIREGLKVPNFCPLSCRCFINVSAQLGIQNHYVDGIPALYAASDLLFQPMCEKFKSPSPRVALGVSTPVIHVTLC